MVIMVSSASHSWDNHSNGNSNTSNNSEATTHPFMEVLPSDYSTQCHEAANEILIESQQQAESSQQARVRMSLMKLHPLGLTLPITPSLIDSVHREVNDYYRGNVGEVKPNLINQSPTTVDAFGSHEKVKAACIKTNFIRIGTWERTTKHYDDLMAKCYFAKRKLVWEVMINRLKHKIEILWSDIIAIRACSTENGHETLEIELRERPSFYLEEEPQPRKHTIWKIAPDFTNGQASICRRHFLAFPPGALDKLYQKLLECDPRLSELSKKGFPSLLSSLYFDPTNYGPPNFSFVNFNGGRIQPMEQQIITTIPSPIVATQPYLQEMHSPISVSQKNYTPGIIRQALPLTHSSCGNIVMDFSHSDQHYINHRQAYDDPRTESWVQELSNYAGRPAASEQVQVSSNPFSPTASSQFYNISSHHQEAQGVNFGARPVRKIENHLMGNWELVNCEDLNISSHNQGVQGVNFDARFPGGIENNLVGDWGIVNWNHQIPLPIIDSTNHQIPLPIIDSTNTLLNVMPEQNHEGTQNPCIEQDMYTDGNGLILIGSENVHVPGRQFYPLQQLQQPQHVSRVAPLASPNDPVMHQTWNNLGYDPRIEGASDGSVNGMGANYVTQYQLEDALKGLPDCLG